jgi:hypothetical protein
MLQVIVGQTFHGDLTPGPSDNTPTHEPPAVTTESVAAGELKSVRKKAGFPLYTPTLRDSVVLAFHAGAGAGVQGRRPQPPSA